MPETRLSNPTSTTPAEKAPRTKESLRLTSRDYAHPHRPGAVKAANALGRGLSRLGIQRPLDTESIVEAAKRQSGCPEGSRVYREGLDVLVAAIEKDADLNPVGRMITRSRLVSALAARFRAEAMMEANPSILDRPLAPPLVITGLQRTGTTLLHRLLATDPRFRSLSSWEVLNPVPPKAGRRDPRRKAALRAEKGARWMAPDFFAVHPVDHAAPEEDVLLLDTSFRSTVAEAILRVPVYAAWLESVDSTPAYAFMRRLLLLFQSVDQRPAWVLKTPHHLEFLDVLLNVFPEAKVVQTHRDPAKTTGSFLSMVAHGYGLFTDSPDAEDIGRHWLRKCRRMVTKGIEYRDSLDPAVEKETFLDIQFRDLVTDPIAVLDRIYGFFGMDFDSDHRQRGKSFLASHGRHRYGRHVYDLGDFGLDEDQIRRNFAEYSKRYAIPQED